MAALKTHVRMIFQTTLSHSPMREGAAMAALNTHVRMIFQTTGLAPPLTHPCAKARPWRR